MYARDLSVKVRNAKRQRAKQGLFVGSQTPYGYTVREDNKNQLVIDPEAAEVVRLIFSLAERGMGNVAIADELKARRIIAPSVYKFLHGDTRFARYVEDLKGDDCRWCHGTIGQILNNPVYTGNLISLKTEVINCKTKQRIAVPADRRIVTQNAHEAIVTIEQFDKVKQARADHKCVAKMHRDNLFRGRLFCECCGHPLTISRKQLKEKTTDIYLCMHHYSHPEACPKTHRVYHDMLYPYVLQQVKAFAKSMKRRKVNSPISSFAYIEELTPEILAAVINRIEISHVKYNSKPGQVIHIYWKLS